MKKIIFFYRNLSITVKFTLIIVLAFILLTGSILFSANLYTKERLDTYFAVHTSSNEQLMEKIDGYISDISNVTKIPLTYKINDSAYIVCIRWKTMKRYAGPAALMKAGTSAFRMYCCRIRS